MPLTSEDIPNGSIMTEEMISWYRSKYSVGRSAAIAAIRLLENGSGTIPSDLDTRLFSVVISSYYQNRGSVAPESVENQLTKGQTADNQVLTSSSDQPSGFKYLSLASLITALGSLAITASLALTGHFSASSAAISGGISSATSTVTSEATVAGLVITGNVTSTSVVRDSVVTFTSVSTSQVLCSQRNTTGADIVLPNYSFMYATNTATGGNYRVTVSQSSSAATTGTGSDLYWDSTFAAPTNGINNINSTSTITGVIDGNATTSPARVIWKSGNYINTLIASPTSTLTGSCRIPSY